MRAQRVEYFARGRGLRRARERLTKGLAGIVDAAENQLVHARVDERNDLRRAPPEFPGKL